ncbi:MAG: hypothetical protein ACREIM_09085, partial [Nitrospiraceae bacterium]
TRPAHHSRASTSVALIILRTVDLAGVRRSPKTLGAHKTRPPHISAAFTTVTRFIQRVVNLAPVRRHDAPYSSRRAPGTAALDGHFEHPAWLSFVIQHNRAIAFQVPPNRFPTAW